MAWTSAVHSAGSRGGVTLPRHQKTVCSPLANPPGMKPSSRKGRTPAASQASTTWSTWVKEWWTERVSPSV